MKSIIVATLAVLAVLVPGTLFLAPAIKNVNPPSSVFEPPLVEDAPVLDPIKDLVEAEPIKLYPVKKIITLEARNTVVFRGPVTQDSVGKAMRELRDISRRVSKDTPIFLVLDTPGGSVFDGLDFIDFAKALPQKVHTVTLFAASMGFHIAQNLETRYIIRNGVLMSHRASLGGLSGQLDGELETRYRMIKRSVDLLDFIAAKRLGLKTPVYKDMIYNEYWVHGYDAVGDKAADEQVLLRCGRSLDGSVEETFRTMFGNVRVTFAKCPMMKAPLKVDFSRLFEDDEDYNEDELEELVDSAFFNKRKFVQKYITTGRFYEIFP